MGRMSACVGPFQGVFDRRLTARVRPGRPHSPPRSQRLALRPPPLPCGPPGASIKRGIQRAGAKLRSALALLRGAVCRRDCCRVLMARRVCKPDAAAARILADTSGAEAWGCMNPRPTPCGSHHNPYRPITLSPAPSKALAHPAGTCRHLPAPQARVPLAGRVLRAVAAACDGIPEKGATPGTCASVNAALVLQLAPGSAPPPPPRGSGWWHRSCLRTDRRRSGVAGFIPVRRGVTAVTPASRRHRPPPKWRSTRAPDPSPTVRFSLAWFLIAERYRGDAPASAGNSADRSRQPPSHTNMDDSECTRGAWSRQEDLLLQQLVSSLGTRSWVATQGGRSTPCKAAGRAWT
jgi:hypothetical protein